jgi:hypothetical protein
MSNPKKCPKEPNTQSIESNKERAAGPRNKRIEVSEYAHKTQTPSLHLKPSERRIVEGLRTGWETEPEHNEKQNPDDRKANRRRGLYSRSPDTTQTNKTIPGVDEAPDETQHRPPATRNHKTTETEATRRTSKRPALEAITLMTRRIHPKRDCAKMP